jgi:ribonucleoside-diphosphate reductase alpha chain
MGNTECFEPITSNLYKRATGSGEFIMINKYLVEDLIEANLWTDTIKQKIMASEGSIQNIAEIPNNIKNLYKTIWEISQRDLIDMSADRGAFICQTQSLNLYFKDINLAKLTSAYFYGWKKGLKTIVYYTRTQNKGAIKFTVDKNIEDELKQEEIACSLENPESCVMCSA